MKVELISKTVGVGIYEEINQEEIVVAIARHGTIKEDNGVLIKYLMSKKHWSPLQHISFGFKIETRRSISAQIFRHRSLNGQEWSLRYAEPLGFEEIDIRREHPTNRQSSTDSFNPEITFGNRKTTVRDEYNLLMLYIDDLYNKSIEAGVAKECARDILPLCTKTTIHITGTLRDLLGFINVRHTQEAQLEVRLIAEKMAEALEKELPDVFSKIDWRGGLFM
tara:strand:+ start:804 stop:1469 length:666 start_codon:yes stop_codon:yes gene_type:complete